MYLLFDYSLFYVNLLIIFVKINQFDFVLKNFSVFTICYHLKYNLKVHLQYVNI